MKKSKIIISIIVAVICFVIVDKKESNDKTNSNNIGGTLIVNNDNMLSKDYKPKNMKTLDLPFINSSKTEEMKMDNVAAKSVEELYMKAKEDGINYLATSAYRSYEYQKEIYNKKVLSDGYQKANEYVAKPGYSEHQSGLCIDLTNEERWFDESTKEAKWLADNAYKFGFILRYPKGKEDITGKAYEPWHIRYVGRDIAKKIYEKQITLEEYLYEKTNL